MESDGLQKFADRAEAGRHLARRLGEYNNREDVVVLGLSRGGIPVAFEVARELSAPLDVMVVRKLGVPGHEELAFGAIASGGHRIINKEMLAGMSLSEACIDEIIAREGVELERRMRMYNGNSPHVSLRAKTVILIDDGLATGATMEAAVSSVLSQRPKEVIVASPVAPAETCEQLAKRAGVRCICMKTPEPFYAVGLYYINFAETTDEDVMELLAKSRSRIPAQTSNYPAGGTA